MSYARPIFAENQQYRSLQTFKSGPTTVFQKGEKLLFLKDYYVPHDDSFVYEFRSLSTGEVKQWWLHDGEPKEVWHALFTDDGP